MNVLRAIAVTAFAGAAIHAAPASAFDFDNEMAPFLIGPTAAPSMYAVSPLGGDATLVLRFTHIYATAWYDAIAPYSPVSVGIYSNVARRPASEATNANMNIAIFYASHHVSMSLFPHQATEWRDLMLDVGLDPDDTSTDITTPIGIGNVTGAAVVEAKENDGMNQRGDGNGRVRHLKPYEDTTGYAPKNTAYELKEPSRWQPLITTSGNGLFRVQQFVTPQYGRTQAFAYDDVDQFTVPKPSKSDYKRNRSAYRAQAAEVLAASAALTDEQKMIAELFNDKLVSLGTSTGFVAVTRGYTMRQFIELDLIVQAATWDTGIAVWKEKARHDAVRPVSAIRMLYAGQEVTAWGGRGVGTVTDVPGEHWDSYLPTADHPDYPSGSATFCGAHAEAMRAYTGTDVLGWPVVFPAGSSRIEPGVTPATDISFVFDTWSEFEEVCAMSRVWGGVHFVDAVVKGGPLGREIGEITSDFILAHIDGTIADDDDSDSDHGHGHGHGHDD